MAQPRENHLWFVAIVSSALGVILGAAWLDAHAEDDWLYRYQTLIAGIAAVAAAYLTVNAMQKTDEQQQHRHEELMRLTLRADRLKARRAAFPNAEQLLQLTAGLESRIVSFRRIAVKLGDEHRHRMEQVFRYRSLIVAILQNEGISEAKDMFGSAMAFTYRRLEQSFCTDDHEFEYAQEYVRGQSSSPSQYHLSVCEKAVERIEDNLGDIRSFSAQLLTLAGHYGPD